MTTLSLNKKARFDYQILETFEAGIVLAGQEVKSIRQGQASLNGAYVTIDKNQEVKLLNANIPAYKMAGQLPDYESTQTRKLLLHRQEINYLEKKLQQPGLTLIPLSFYTKNSKIKLEIGLAKGKKLYDKRQSIRAKEDQRKIQRVLKHKMQRG